MTKNNSTFADLNLAPEILKAINLAGYETPTPIQLQAIPEILNGRDIFGCAQTGTGKTAAFSLPILQKLSENMKFVERGEFRALILTPTRELAEQIYDNVASYAKFLDLRIAKIYGGVSQIPQVKALDKGLDVLIATPGRLLDIFSQKKLSFRAVEYLVLDEADRMLDMGFIRDIRKICKELPGDRQSLLFSATLAPEVQSLASTIVRDPIKIAVNPESPTVEKIAQKMYFVDSENKIPLLKEIILQRFKKDENAIALVFCRTKHGANKVANRLSGAEFNASVIHGNKSQSSRKNALQRFKDRESRVLVATDIAARGIDVKAMPLVINYDLPEEAETYIHRIGRTARAEAEGEAISFCSASEVPLARAIERLIKKNIPCPSDNPYVSQQAKELKDSNKKINYVRPELLKRAAKKSHSTKDKDDEAYGASEFSYKHSQKNRGSSNSSRANSQNRQGQSSKSGGRFADKDDDKRRGKHFHSTKSNPAKFQVSWAIRKRSVKSGAKKD